MIQEKNWRSWLEDRFVLSMCGIDLVFLLICSLSYYYFPWGGQLFYLVGFLMLGNLPTVLCGQYESSRWVQGVAEFFSAFSFICCAYMGAHTFTSRIDSHDVFVVGMVLVLAFAYLFRSNVAAMVYVIIADLSLLVFTFASYQNVYGVLLLLLLPYGYLQVKKEGKSLAFYVLIFLEIAGWLIYLFQHPGRSTFGIWLYVLYGFWMVIYLVDMRLHEQGTPFYHRPLWMLSYGGVSLVYLMGSMADRWENRVVAGTGDSINIVFCVLMVVICIFYIERVLRSRITLDEILMCAAYYISFAVYIFYEFYTTSAGRLMADYYMLLMVVITLSSIYKLMKYHNWCFQVVPVTILASYGCLLYTNGEYAVAVVLICLMACAALIAGGIARRKNHGQE